MAGEFMSADALDAKAAIGFVPQDIALYPDLSARENFRFFGRLQGIPKRQLEQRIDEVLDVIGLSERANDNVGSYSGGMKRRCNIGVALLHDPQLLVLDEPTVGVDPQSRHSILESIEVLGRRGLSVLYTTHYMEEAERLCDRVGILDEGRLVAEGTSQELIESIGEHTLIKVDARGNGFSAFVAACRGFPFVHGASAIDGSAELLVSDPREALAPIVEAARDHGLHVSSVDITTPDLETVFLHLTGKALRN